MDINKLSMDEKIGQRFIFGVNSCDIESILTLIKDAHIGGVMLEWLPVMNYMIIFIL